jgi:hypothetical protein
MPAQGFDNGRSCVHQGKRIAVFDHATVPVGRSVEIRRQQVVNHPTPEGFRRIAHRFDDLPGTRLLVAQPEGGREPAGCNGPGRDLIRAFERRDGLAPLAAVPVRLSQKVLRDDIVRFELGGPQALFDRLVESSRVKEVCSPDRMSGRVQRILLHGASHLGSGFLETSKPAKIETGVNPPRVT